MFTKIVLIICICCLLILAAMMLDVAYLTRKKSTDKNSGSIGESRWDGVLPKKVDDFTSPRYVYEDNHECAEPQPEHGRIIGYRISPTLVIHSCCEYAVTPPTIAEYLDKLGGRMLRELDIDILLQNWDAISDLRVKAGDTPLKKETFWYQSGDSPVAYYIKNSSYWPNAMVFSDCKALLILKI
jgi:hypothetical protein